jgi:alpha-ketoglutarate-dependent 2,4-dichlorophenoxyacetate dioxygenase
VRIDPVLPRFGAQISDIDLTRPLSAQERRGVVDAINEWGVCVYRNTGLTDETHIAFSRIFGHLERAPARKGARTRLAHRELFDAGNLDPDGEITKDARAIEYRKGDRLWHTDSAFMQQRSSYSLLLAHAVPLKGGETWFADARSAYEDLPQSMKDRIEGLEGLNSVWWSRRKAGADIPEEMILGTPLGRHKIVHTHAGSGRKSLFIAAHTMDIVGMPSDEGRALIDELIAWATQPQYVFSVKYEVGVLVIWDNLSTMHRGGEFDSANEKRDMRRTTVREGTEPFAQLTDDPFGELFATAPKQVDLVSEMQD